MINVDYFVFMYVFCYIFVLLLSSGPPLPSKNVLCCHSDENGLRVKHSVLADVQHL